MQGEGATEEARWQGLMEIVVMSQYTAPWLTTYRILCLANSEVCVCPIDGDNDFHSGDCYRLVDESSCRVHSGHVAHLSHTHCMHICNSTLLEIVSIAFFL